MKKKTYRMILLLMLLLDLSLIFLFVFFRIQKKIPDKLYLYPEKIQKFDFSLPVQGELYPETTTVVCNQFEKKNVNICFDFQEPFSLYAKEKGSCVIRLKMFGVIPVHSIKVNVISDREVYAGGQTVGIRVDTNGILVLGIGKILDADGIQREPARNIVKTGDYIQKLNGESVESKEELIRKLKTIKDGKVVLNIKRGDELLRVCINAVESKKNEWKLGIWVRDDTQGIGTLTFVKKNRQFVALGHGITDVDTGMRMEVKGGYLCDVGIYEIVKGQKGKPGEIAGYLKIEKASRIGRIQSNTSTGIVGKMENMGFVEQKSMPIGLKQEIQEGKAEILCQLGDCVSQYEICIEKVYLGNREKSMVLKVTDPRLLEKTGGIVQGMSGSPILQNGKIIGAVTHVFVKDPTKGYGIFIEELLEK